ncbi:MAG: hypothetical protein NPIRA01_31480 [Nitrospirales bacterium]|nr:MAG: hypothetical protein NPIRA01_31480 [Nitrospirales bacterium]
MDPTINNEYPAVAQALGTYYDGLIMAIQRCYGYVTVSNGELLHLDMKSYLSKVEAHEHGRALRLYPRIH